MPHLCRTYLLVDPCEREERVMDGLLMIAMNKHREICSIQSSGGIMLLKEQVRGRRVLVLFLGVLAFTNFKISEKKRERSSEQLNKLLNELFNFYC